MKRLIWFLIPLVLASSCPKHYILNKFEIKGFEFQKGFGYPNVGIVKFHVNYYTDSTQAMYFDSIEKGRDGSSQRIKYIGLRSPDTKYSQECNFTPADSFISRFNRNQKPYSGQSLQSDYTFCFSSRCDTNDIFILVLEDKNKGSIDTLQCKVH